MTQHIYMPTFYEHIDNKSLTKNSENDFFYTKLPQGITINSLHAISIAKQAHISDRIIMENLAYAMAQEYFFFLCIINERPELADDIWGVIKQFYYTTYRTYIKYINKYLDQYFFSTTLPKIRSRNKNWSHFTNYNIKRFIEELETEYYCPLRYLT